MSASPPMADEEPRGATDRVARDARARALRFGIDALDSFELLRLIAGRELRARERTDALHAGELMEWSRSEVDELAVALGLPCGAATRVAAAFALARRVGRVERAAGVSLRSAAQVFAFVAPELHGLEREVLVALLLDGKHRLKRREVISVGTLTGSLVHPREFFRGAVRSCAAAAIAVHNHPSGDPEPSPEDLEVTRRLHQAGELLGVPLLDHVVVGDRSYVSLRERMSF